MSIDLGEIPQALESTAERVHWRTVLACAGAALLAALVVAVVAAVTARPIAVRLITSTPTQTTQAHHQIEVIADAPTIWFGDDGTMAVGVYDISKLAPGEHLHCIFTVDGQWVADQDPTDGVCWWRAPDPGSPVQPSGAGVAS